MKLNPHSTPLKSVLLVCCLSSGLALARPIAVPRAAEPNPAVQVERANGPVAWLRALRLLFARSAGMVKR
jgi:hypothetical protein